MRAVLLGASGFVGSAILKEALDREHQVTAVLRNQANMADNSRANPRGRVARRGAP